MANMARLSTIENLPSELLESITDYLDLPVYIKAWRLCCKRSSAFGGLFETVHVFTTKDSLQVLSSVSQHSGLSKEVRTVVCWMPIFYQSYTKMEDYAELVYQSQANIAASKAPAIQHVEPITEPRAFNGLCDFPSPVSNEWYDRFDFEAEARQRVTATELLQGLENFNAYYNEQQEILQNELVPALAAAFKLFPKLRTVRINTLLNNNWFGGPLWVKGEGPNFSSYHHTDHHLPALKKEILVELGERPDYEPTTFMHLILRAIATSEISLRTFSVDPRWNHADRNPGILTLPTSSPEQQNMRKAFKPLRHLAFSLCDDNAPDGSASCPMDQFATALLLTPALESLKLSFYISDYTLPSTVFWPRLRSFVVQHGWITSAHLHSFFETSSIYFGAG